MHDTYRLVVYIWCEYVNGSSLNKCCSPYFMQICVVFFFTCSSLHPPRPERENNTWEFHKTVWAPPFPHFIGRTLDYCRVIISYNKLHHFYCLDVLLKCHCRPTGFFFFTVSIWYSTIINFCEQVSIVIIIWTYTRRNWTIQQPQIPTHYSLF